MFIDHRPDFVHIVVAVKDIHTFIVAVDVTDFTVYSHWQCCVVCEHIIVFFVSNAGTIVGDYD